MKRPASNRSDAGPRTGAGRSADHAPGVAAVLLATNTIACAIPILLVALVKLVLPFKPVRRVVDPVLNTLATAWISVNNGMKGDELAPTITTKCGRGSKLGAAFLMVGARQRGCGRTRGSVGGGVAGWRY